MAGFKNRSDGASREERRNKDHDDHSSSGRSSYEHEESEDNDINADDNVIKEAFEGNNSLMK